MKKTQFWKSNFEFQKAWVNEVTKGKNLVFASAVIVKRLVLRKVKQRFVNDIGAKLDGEVAYAARLRRLRAVSRTVFAPLAARSEATARALLEPLFAELSVGPH